MWKLQTPHSRKNTTWLWHHLRKNPPAGTFYRGWNWTHVERAQFVPDYLGCNASASPGASRCDNRSPVELLNQFAAAGRGERCCVRPAGVYYGAPAVCVSSRLFESGRRAEPSFHWGDGRGSSRAPHARRWFPASARRNCAFLLLGKSVFGKPGCAFHCGMVRRKPALQCQQNIFSSPAVLSSVLTWQLKDKKNIYNIQLTNLLLM